MNYTKSFSSKTLAKRDETKVKAEIEAGIYMKQDEKMTFKEASELYMSNMIEGSCKETTKTSYYGYLNNHILPYLGKTPLFNITKLDCDAFVTAIKK
ncbi:MAG: N-terminal phage integrase SAM-like domain-containing protein [Candidatus Gastranaerophilales bacterium]|nr:N-terminal phage integrase SAM-like domain-containing protein [Candidatus Gastranaerophilales bacterium]